MTTLANLETQLAAAFEDLEKAKQKLVELRRQLPPEPVEDYELTGPDGGVRLSAMFGDKSDLILIHNMGSGCPYCTMWADEFNGVLHHLESRAAFVVVSPDSPETQTKSRHAPGLAVSDVLGRRHHVYRGHGVRFGGRELRFSRNARCLGLP